MEAGQIKRTTTYKKIKAALMEQLERAGNDTPFFIDLVGDYMKLYVSKELAAADVAKRGVVIESIGSTGNVMTKKNDAVDMQVKINSQMLKILDQLHIRAEVAAVEDDEEL